MAVRARPRGMCRSERRLGVETEVREPRVDLVADRGGPLCRLQGLGRCERAGRCPDRPRRLH